MLVGYARTSTVEQEAGFEAQLKELKALGCEKMFHEQVSSVAERVKLERALEFIREGDVFIVTKLDRLARDIRDLLKIVDRITAKGASIRVLDLGLDTKSATGELILTVLGGIAQFERKRMLERQREGIAKAKSEGKFKGRKPTAMAKAAQILKLRREGIKPAEIAHRLEICRASVYNVLNAHTT